MGSLMFKLAMSAYLLSLLGVVLLVFGSRETPVVRRWTLALYAGFTFHALALIHRLVMSGRTPIATQYESLSFFSWCVIGFFLLLVRRYKAASLGIVLIPISCLLMIYATLWNDGISPLGPMLQSQWLPIHGIVSFLGEAALGLAFAAGVFYMVQEARIKGKRLGAVGTRLPSLETLDEINYFSVTLGFPLLTAGIITGSIWASSAWGSWWNWDPKEVWSLVTWLVYAALLHQRINVGWRGRKAAVMAVLGFCCVMFTFIGVNLLPGLHSYAHLER